MNTEQCIENIWNKKGDDHQLRWSSPWKTNIEQRIENIWKKKSDDHQLRWSSQKFFFRNTLKNIREKKCEKKEQHPPFGERRSGPFLQSDDFRWKDKS